MHVQLAHVLRHKSDAYHVDTAQIRWRNRRQVGMKYLPMLGLEHNTLDLRIMAVAPICHLYKCTLLSYNKKSWVTSHAPFSIGLRHRFLMLDVCRLASLFLFVNILAITIHHVVFPELWHWNQHRRDRVSSEYLRDTCGHPRTCDSQVTTGGTQIYVCPYY